MIQGYEVLAQALAKQNLTHSFGIIGIPVIELGMALQANGFHYFGFRNEQAAAYAAGIVGYLTKRPGVVLAVSGPGMTNCISGMANALVNKWPMVCISGASDASLEGKGAFQEFDQIACAKPSCKYAARPANIKHIPYIVERAVRLSMYGTPGPVYIDLPADLLFGKVAEKDIEYFAVVDPLPSLILPPSMVEQTLRLLKSAKQPLVIVGKGVAYGNAEQEMRSFISKSQLPFLATPMGKGVMKDSDKHSVGSARTFVLKNADVVFLCGARLNWILHFGEEPRFRKNVKIIQLDSDPHEMHTNVKAEIPIVGDSKVILGQLSDAIKEPLISYQSQWWTKLQEQTEKNKQASDKLYQDKTVPMNYYSTLKIIEDAIHQIPQDFILVSEGSNTMDIGRTILTNENARQRLDAGTFGTMGVGFGFAIAAQSLYPDKKVVMVVGDSAFGFSGMEMETAARYKLPLKVIIVNNNGIGQGVEEIEKGANAQEIPPGALLPEAKYEMISIAFGGKGDSVSDHKSLAEKLKEMLTDNNLWVLNVHIDPYAGKKAQEFSWLTRKNDEMAKEELPKL